MGEMHWDKAVSAIDGFDLRVFRVSYDFQTINQKDAMRQWTMILQGLICVESQLLGTIIFICSIGMVQFNSRIFTFSDFIQVFWASYL